MAIKYKKQWLLYALIILTVFCCIPNNRAAAEDMITVAVSMEKFTLGQGYIIEPTLVTVPANTQASVVITDLLHEKYGEETRPYKLTGSIMTNFYLAHVLDDGNTKPYVIPHYILAAIEEEGSEFSLDNDEWLGEFDFFKHSGWMYAINNVFPSVGAAGWTLQNHQVMRWQYTIYGLGADLNANNEAWGTEAIVKTAQKDNLTWRVAEINRLPEAEKNAFLQQHEQQYNNAYAVLTNMESTQADVDAALQALGGVSRVAEEVTATMPQQARVVNEAIQSLPSNIKLTDAEMIASIRAQYDALEETMQQWIWKDEVNALQAAEQKIRQLQTSVTQMVEQINALPTAEAFHLQHEAALKEAQTTYARLTKEQQQAVTNAQQLTVLTTQLAVLKEEQPAIEAVMKAIANLPKIEDVTAQHTSVIFDVSRAYEALTKAGQQAVTNVQLLQAVLKKLETSAPSSAVEQVMTYIEQLSIADAASITRAQQAYEKLAAAEKAQVTNYDVLQAALQQLQQINAQAAKVVQDLINALPDEANIEQSHSALLTAIEQAYQALTKEQQALVTNSNRLHTARIAFEALKYKPTDEQVAAGVTKLIEALPFAETITIAHEQIVKDIRKTYDALTKAQQALVKNEQKLREVEQALPAEDVDVQVIVAEIDALPTNVTAAMQETIAMLRQGYDALTNTQQQLVSNYDKLVSAEQQLSAVQTNAQAIPIFWQTAVAQSKNVTALREERETLYVTAADGQAITLSEAFLQQARDSNVARLLITQANMTITIPQVVWTEELQQTSRLYVHVQQQSVQLTEQLANGVTRDVTLPRDYVVVAMPMQGGMLTQLVGGEQKAIPHTIKDGITTIYINENAQFTYVTQTKTFDDINGISAQEDIEYLATRYVVNGTTDATFAPTAAITRAQFGAMIARALNLHATEQSVYADTKGKWYEDNIQALYEAGITHAVGDFNPNAPLTREHAAAFMFRTLQYIDADVATTSTLTYTDKGDVQRQFVEAVSTLNTLHIMEGKEGNRFDAKGALTRAQMAKILRRTLAHVNMM